MAKPKERKKPTGKEIAVVVISIIMVISILLPSFAQIFAAPRTSQSFLPLLMMQHRAISPR